MIQSIRDKEELLRILYSHRDKIDTSSQYSVDQMNIRVKAEKAKI